MQKNTFFKAKKRFLIVGPRLNGSTRVFNLLRFLSKAAGYKTYSSSIIGYDFAELSEVHIIKAHDAFDNEAQRIKMLESSHVILPFRDVRDCAVSHQTRWPDSGKSYLEVVLNHIALHYKYEKDADLTVKYENYSDSQVQKICKILDLPYETHLIDDAMNLTEELYNSDDVPENEEELQDLESEEVLVKMRTFKKHLYTKATNTSGGKSEKYKEFFSEEENNKILDNLMIKAFLDQHGYL